MSDSDYDVQEEESVDVQNPMIPRMSEEPQCSSQEEVKERNMICGQNRI